jgi:hypothetical protein
LTKDFETRAILQKLDDDKLARERAAHILATGTDLLGLISGRDAAGVAALLTAHAAAYPEILDFEATEVSIT